MDVKEASWHEAQAKRIETTDRKIREAKLTLAFRWWQVGKRLNFLLGDEGYINKDTMDFLMKCYNLNRPRNIHYARRFHLAVPDQEKAIHIISEYDGAWTKVSAGFLAGHSRDTIHARRKAGDAKRRNKPHNIPEHLLDGLIDLGLSESEAIEAVKHFMATTPVYSVYAVWRKHTAEAA